MPEVVQFGLQREIPKEVVHSVLHMARFVVHFGLNFHLQACVSSFAALALEPFVMM